MKTPVPPKKGENQPGIGVGITPESLYIRQHYKGSGKLKDKVALITGGDSGIGRAVAIHFAREGADVAIVYLPQEDADAQQTKDLVEAEGRRCLLLSGDLADPAFCEQIVEDTVQQFGRLNILVNNAGVQHVQEHFEQLQDETLVKTYEVNIYSFFRVTKAAVKYMHEGDAIINTSSITAYQGHADLIDYSSTKGAIMTFTRALSSNLAGQKIRVNGVAPGPIWTPLIPSTMDEEAVSRFGKDVPMKRPGQPAEVAPAYVFLASDDSSYVTGAVLHPNGGTVINT